LRFLLNHQIPPGQKESPLHVHDPDIGEESLLESGDHGGSLIFEPLDHGTFNAIYEVQSTGHGQAVHHLEAISSIRDDAGLLEHGQVLGDVRHACAEVIHNVADAFFSVPEEFDYSQTEWMPHSLEDLGLESESLVFAGHRVRSFISPFRQIINSTEGVSREFLTHGQKYFAISEKSQIKCG
jgi:hypothetical protein